MGDHCMLSQGGWEADETVEAAAARETVEEAGVRGTLEVSLWICKQDTTSELARLVALGQLRTT